MLPCFIKPLGCPNTLTPAAHHVYYLSFLLELALPSGRAPSSTVLGHCKARPECRTWPAVPNPWPDQSKRWHIYPPSLQHCPLLELPKSACFSRPWGVGSFLSLSVYFFFNNWDAEWTGERRNGKRGVISKRASWVRLVTWFQAYWGYSVTPVILLPPELSLVIFSGVKWHIREQ